MREDVIERLADYLLKNLPSDPIKLIHVLGGRIDYDLAEPHISASIRKDGEFFVVNINERYDKKDSKFKKQVLLHCIGHLFLHMKFKLDDEEWLKEEGVYVDSPYYNPIYKYTKEDDEADFFMRAMLLPKNLFTEKLLEFTKDGMVSLDKLAKYFKTSICQVQERAKELRLVKADY